ncbi:MAG: cysteine desulfurase [Planctomycetes bacterium]|nr:cysteine desulfurase [Planctomycetota bacterium]
MITAKSDSADTLVRTDAQSFDVEAIRRDFPILQQTVNGKPLVYLDNAATTQKPRAVIDAITDHYLKDNANIHRGVHELSVRATAAYEKVRAKVRDFIGADRTEEIVFLRSTTEAVNLVAQTYGHSVIQPGDEILISTLEHHSNIVPWQMLCEQTGAVLKVAPINDAGEIILEEYEKLLGPRTMLVAVTHVSNALGTITPIKEIIDIAHRSEVRVLVDGAQAVPHTPVDVRDLDCDFYAFSSHKLFGPTGVGVLYGKYDLLNGLPPYQGGGEMILSVSFDGTTYNELPFKFEAGTPNIAGVIGFGAAIDYINAVGMERIAAYERDILDHATQTLSAIPGVRIIGTATEKASVVSFVVEGVHPHDVGTILDQLGIAVRTGHHCAQPLMERFGLTATARASFAFYNTRDEVDALADGIRQVIEVFGG